MNLYTHIQQSIQEQYEKACAYSKRPYVKELCIVLAMFILMGCGYIAFGWYQKRQNMQAFAGLVEIAKSYESSVQKSREQKNKPVSEQVENPWEDTQLLLEALAPLHTGSSLSPFFVMYQAQIALEAEGDYDKACKLMEQGLRRLAKNSVYYDMFNLKRIKMLLDSPMQDVRDKAVVELEQVAHQTKNYYAQEALYTLGVYCAYHGKMDQAIDAWKKLAQQHQSEKALISSPWVQQAQEKLKTLNISL